jgi:hypothetical protein
MTLPRPGCISCHTFTTREGWQLRAQGGRCAKLGAFRIADIGTPGALGKILRP